MKIINDAEIVAIKVGTSLITDVRGAVRHDWVSSLADDIAELTKTGKKIVIISSGAVALGMEVLGSDSPANLMRLEEKQAAAACGQSLLVELWRKAFSKHEIGVAQLLLTIDDSENRRRYLNARTTLEMLLSKNIIPIINENDAVATAELRVGDNDRMSARVAQMVSADMLILLSDVDGLYDKNPMTNKDANLIEEITNIDENIRNMASGSTSEVGTGGMTTKLDAAEIATKAGCHMIISSGLNNNPIKSLMDGGKHSWFVAGESSHNARKDWIAGGLKPLGEMIIDEGAAAAIASGKSLLPVGVKEINGEFARGEAVLIKTQDDRLVAKGLSAYSSVDAERIIGSASADIENILGFKGRNAIIHRDNMVIV